MTIARIVRWFPYNRFGAFGALSVTGFQVAQLEPSRGSWVLVDRQDCRCSAVRRDRVMPFDLRKRVHTCLSAVSGRHRRLKGGFSVVAALARHAHGGALRLRPLRPPRLPGRSVAYTPVTSDWARSSNSSRLSLSLRDNPRAWSLRDRACSEPLHERKHHGRRYRASRAFDSPGPRSRFPRRRPCRMRSFPSRREAASPGGGSGLRTGGGATATARGPGSSPSQRMSVSSHNSPRRQPMDGLVRSRVVLSSRGCRAGEGSAGQTAMPLRQPAQPLRVGPGELPRPELPAPVALARPGHVHPRLGAEAENVLSLDDRELGA